MPVSSNGNGLQELLSALASGTSKEEAHESEEPHLDTNSTAASTTSSHGTINENEEEEEQPEEKPDSMTQPPAKMSAFDIVCQHLDQEDMFYGIKRDKGLIQSTLTGNNGTYQVVIDVKEQSSILIVYVMLPCKVPPNKRLDIAEFITRANYGIMIGNFELDFLDGECRYKGSLDFSGGVLVGSMIEQLIGKSAYTMNRYFPGIMNIIYGNVNAKDAIAEIEPNQSRGDAGEALAQLLVEALANGGDAPESTQSADSEGTPVVFATPAL